MVVHHPPLISFLMDISLHTAGRLDIVRGFYLRIFLSLAPLKRIYVDRHARLFTSYVLGGILSLALSAAYPLWVLAIGPVFFGLPHLIASFRYSSGTEFRKPFLTAALFLSTIICLFHLAQLKGLVGYGAKNAMELGALAALFLAMIVFAKAQASARNVAVFLLPLFMLSWRYPFQTIGAMVLIHNVIAFFYWYRATRTSDDRLVVSISLGLFLAANVAIFSGVFDGWVFNSATEALGMKIWEVGSLILPDTIQYEWLARATVAYAFGQSIHYFIWLRAIPEQTLPHPTPTSFRQSLFYLRRDLGPRLARFSILLVVALSSVWLLYEIAWARVVYLCIAAFHGYAELAGLCLKGKSA